MTSQVVTVSQAIAAGAANATLGLDVSCPAGRAALGGGGRINNATNTQDVVINQSNPIFTGTNPPTGWHVQASQHETGGTVWTLVAYVVCGP